MFNSQDINRLRENMKDKDLYEYLRQSDDKFKASSDRVMLQRPPQNALEEYNYPKAMIDIFYQGQKPTFRGNEKVDAMYNDAMESQHAPKADYSTYRESALEQMKDQPLSYIGETMSNIPATAWELTKGMWNLVRHPVESGKTALKLGMGGATNTLESIADLAGVANAEDLFDLESEEIAEEVGQFYVQRYGGMENAARTLRDDPVGFLADVSTVFMGAGGLIKGGATAVGKATGTATATATKLGALGKGVRTAQNVGGKMASLAWRVDPIVIPARGVMLVGGGIKSIINPSVSAVKWANKALKINKTHADAFFKQSGIEAGEWALQKGLLTKGTKEEISMTEGVLLGGAKSTGVTKSLLIKNTEKIFFAAKKARDKILGTTSATYDVANDIVTMEGKTLYRPAIRALDELKDFYRGRPEQVSALENVMELATKDRLSLQDVQRIKDLLDNAFDIYKRDGSAKAGQKAADLNVIRNRVKVFIEDAADELNLPDIRMINQDIARSKDLLNAFEQTERSRYMVNSLSLQDSLFGLSAFGITNDFFATAGVIVSRRLLESTWFKTTLAKYLDKLPSSKKKALSQSMKSGKLNAEAKSAIREAVKKAKQEMIEVNTIEEESRLLAIKNQSRDNSIGAFTEGENRLTGLGGAMDDIIGDQHPKALPRESGGTLGENRLAKFKTFSNPEEEMAQILRGARGMTADDIMKVHPNIKLTKDLPAKDIHGNKIKIPDGEVLTPYELKGGKILLQDGETYTVSKNQFANIKGHSVGGEAKPFAPELEGLEESVRGTGNVTLEQHVKKATGKNLSELNPEQQRNWRNNWESNKERFNYTSNTKYENYQLPEGKNYKEILIKSPVAEKGIAGRPIYTVLDKDSNPVLATINKEKATLKAEEIGGSITIDNNIKFSDSVFNSSHWDEPNVISHLRMNERTYKGKKVAFMEELQSDWAREVRKQEDLIKKGDFNETADQRFPQNENLKNWQELSIKRGLKEAVDSNADYFAWINGEQTSARYNLATQVDNVKWEKTNIERVGREGRVKQIVIKAKNDMDINLDIDKQGKILNEPHSQAGWKGKKLDEVLGKGLADKIMEKESGELSGGGLKFGGEWASNLYDKQVKNIVEDLTGGKVEMMDMGLPIDGKKEGFRIVQTGKAPHSFKELTPENIKVGTEVHSIQGSGNSYIITDILGDGKFKAVPKKIQSQRLGEMEVGKDIKLNDPTLERDKQTYNISQKTTTQQGIKLTPRIKAIIKSEPFEMKKPSTKAVSKNRDTNFYDDFIKPKQIKENTPVNIKPEIQNSGAVGKGKDIEAMRTFMKEDGMTVQQAASLRAKLLTRGAKEKGFSLDTNKVKSQLIEEWNKANAKAK